MAKKAPSKVVRRKKDVPSPPPESQRRVAGWRSSKAFATLYAWGALAVLLLTTAYWALQSARLENGNADQLVNSYLFEANRTFQQAQLPSQHSFLLKWPFFYLVHRMGATPTAFMAVTVVLCLATVAGLAFIMYRIARRPQVVGTLFLALSSVLLLIPAQPYPGALLPVNMAMIATRNIEYIFLLAAVYLLITSRRVRSKRFAGGVVCLALLCTTDRLYVTLVLGGAGIAMFVYVLRRHWRWASRAARWLSGGLIALLVSIGVLAIPEVLHITHFSPAVAGPYGLITSVHSLVQGTLYAVLGIATDLGANPTFGTTIIRQMPQQAIRNLFGPGLVAYAVNGMIALVGLWTIVRLAWVSLFAKHEAAVETKARIFSVGLIWTTVATVIVFIGSNHYYAADARYLGLITFTMFIVLAYAARSRDWPLRRWLLLGGICFVAVICGLLVASDQYHRSEIALSIVNDRNVQIVDILQQHPVQTLVGDYWRVIPAKLAAGNRLSVMPLENCTRPRSVLSSVAWQPDLSHQSFAYLLSYDQKLTDYPACTLDQVVKEYGRPNTSVVLVGTIEHPREVLLFYDHGANSNAVQLNTTATVTPINPSELPDTTCDSPTVVNIVAHQDDDLLFLSPDLLHNIQAGYCVRTIYLTAGDAGFGGFFWLSRQRGSEAAYSEMLGRQDIWLERIVRLGDHEYISIASPRSNPKISLVFMHLPDGNLGGRGFRISRYESLAQLNNGNIHDIHSIDGQSTYTADQLTGALAALLRIYQPTEVHTQANYPGLRIHDHSDHLTVSHFAEMAHKQYEEGQFDGKNTVPIKYYLGYPVREAEENVAGPDLDAKKAAFYAYARFDDGVCHNDAECEHILTYYSYLRRQYSNP